VKKVSDKKKWMDLNVPLLAKQVGYKCEVCSCSTSTKDGTIHHLQYTGHDYKKSLEKLRQHNAVIWVCKDCHKREHTAYSPEQVDTKIRNSGNCVLCLNFTWKAWVTMPREFVLDKRNIPICKKCFKTIMDLKVLTSIEVPQDPEIIQVLKELAEEDGETLDSEDYFREEIVFNDKGNLNPLGKKLLSRIQEGDKTGLYGNIKTSNSKNLGLPNEGDSQLELF
jgi:hypothetical protein